jgi:hypothetical protein
VSVKKALLWAAVAALIVFILARPTDASTAVGSAFNAFDSAGNSIGAFIRGLVS